MKPPSKIEFFLNSLTMYKTVLFGLAFLSLTSLTLSFTGLIHFNPLSLILSAILFLFIGFFGNRLFAKLFGATTNTESSLITALILFFLFSPPTTKQEYFTIIIASILASASKFLINLNKAHIFNPAAIAAVVTPLLGFDGSIWWIATPNMLPFTLLVSFLIVRKLRRQKLVTFYFLAFFATLLLTGQLTSLNFLELTKEIITSWPVIFFAGVMLTEPLTMPGQNFNQLLFATLVGTLSALKFHFGPLYSSPELALVIGNIFAFLTTSKTRFTLTLKQIKNVAHNTQELIFTPNKKINFFPGQYIEWTLPHQKTDIRGSRRYFTIASSPTESDLLLTMKIFPDSSSFKKSLVELKVGQKITASHVVGDFLLPENKDERLVFIAGGIGITPFRSMVKYLLDTKQKRDIVLLYASAHKEDFVYQDLFKQAEREIGLVAQYFATKTGKKIDENVINSIPDSKNRTYLVSGPDAMVKNYKNMLNKLGIHKIITDYFPGF